MGRGNASDSGYDLAQVALSSFYTIWLESWWADLIRQRKSHTNKQLMHFTAFYKGVVVGGKMVAKADGWGQKLILICLLWGQMQLLIRFLNCTSLSLLQNILKVQQIICGEGGGQFRRNPFRISPWCFTLTTPPFAPEWILINGPCECSCPYSVNISVSASLASLHCNCSKWQAGCHGNAVKSGKPDRGYSPDKGRCLHVFDRAEALGEKGKKTKRETGVKKSMACL